MKKHERAALVLDRLNEHYPEPPIPLDHSDAFTLLIAVLLSAQCTDKKVNEVTPALFEAGPTPEAMAALGEDAILGHIRQLGLAKTKARNVHKLAHILVNVHGSQVPASFEELEALPGVGINRQRGDGSGLRGPGLSRRHTHPSARPALGIKQRESVARTERDLKALFPEEHWNRLHLQIIFYGREYCTARGCDGRVCPLCKELYPNRRKPVIWNKP